MVTRNFSLQDLPFSRLLTVPEDEKEFLTLEELKPHHLTELNNQQPITITAQEHQYLSDQQLHITQDGIDQNYNVYYDLNTQQKTKYGITMSQRGSYSNNNPITQTADSAQIICITMK